MAIDNEQLREKAKEKQKKVNGFFSEFKQFALKGNVVDLAVGVLVGSAFSGLVKSLTSNLIQPLIDCLGVTHEQGLVVNIGSHSLNFGAFIADIIDFLLMAFIVFLIVKTMNKISKLGHHKEQEATTKKCPFCQTEISIKATRCPNCTSVLEQENTEQTDTE